MVSTVQFIMKNGKVAKSPLVILEELQKSRAQVGKCVNRTNTGHTCQEFDLYGRLTAGKQ